MGIMMAGGFLINALMPAHVETPTFDSGFDTSQTYSFQPQTLQAQGTPVPKVYGTHKMFGNVISTYSETDSDNNNIVLNVLLCLGFGPVSRVYDLKLNDQPVEGFDGVEKYIRLGYLEQELIPNFNDTKTQYNMNDEIKYNDSYTYETVGNSFDGLEVDVTFPKGLYYTNNAGGLDAVTVRIAVSIRKHGSSDPWTYLSKQVTSVTKSATTNYWSLGMWAEGEQVFDLNTLGWGPGPPVWYEVAQGGTDVHRHYDGESESWGCNWWTWRWETRTDYWTSTTSSDYVDVSNAKTEAITKTFKYNITCPSTSFMSQYPPALTTNYVKATSVLHATNYAAHLACSTSTSLVDAAILNSWVANNKVNQRFHINIGIVRILKQFMYENYHDYGTYTNRGVRHFTLWGSNDDNAFADLVYSHDTNWTELVCSQNTFDEHAEIGTSDPKYITVTNVIGYKYYAFKFADNYGESDYMGLRRLVLMIESAELEDKYDIKVEKLTADISNVRYGQDVYLTAVREVYNDDFTYPRSVLVSFRALASGQLSGSLRASFMVEGAIVRYYDETGWHIGYNNNPAWVCYDILTQPVFKDNLSDVWRYDGYNPSEVDTASFYVWAQFCDTLVDDGDGGTEKRFEFNGVFDSQMNMWEAALKVTTSAMATLTWDGNVIFVIIDTIASPTQLFTVGNILQDSFKITYLPFQDRAAEIEANFTNIDKDYERDTYTLVNSNLLTLNNKVTLDLFGLVKPSEVWRILNYHLLCNEKLKRTVAIDVDVEALTSQVGDVVLVQHDVPLWGEGGTVVSATLNTITLDKSVTLVAGHSYGIVIRLNQDDSLVTKNISSSAGTYTTLTISGTFNDIPEKYDIYNVYDIAVDTKPYRVTGFSLAEDQKVSLNLQQYDETIYTGTVSPVLPVSTYSLDSKYVKITGLTLSNRALVDESSVVVRSIIVTYTIPYNPFFDSVEIYCKKTLVGPWLLIGTTKLNSFTISNVDASTVYFVRAIGVSSINGAQLKQLFDSAEVVGIITEGLADFHNVALQERVTGLQIFGQGNDTTFYGRDCKFVWSDIQAVDVSGGAGEEPTGAGYTLPPLWFKDYQVTISNLDGTIRRIDYTVSPEYTYSYERNYEDGNDIPVRDFVIDVRARDRYFRVSGIAAVLVVSNIPPPVVSNIIVEAGVGVIIVSFTPSSATDIAGYIVFASQTPDFIPSTVNLVNTGTESRIVFNPSRSGMWYVKVAAYDTFDNTTLNYSSQYSVNMPSWLEASDIELEFMKMSFQSISWAQFAIFEGFADETKRNVADPSTYKAIIIKNSLIQGDNTPNRTFGFVSKVYTSITTIDTGSSTSVGTNFLTDTSKTWFTNECKGLTLVDSALDEFEVMSNTLDTLTVVGTPASGAYVLKDTLPSSMVAFCSYQDSTEDSGYGFVKMEVSFDDGANWETVLDTEIGFDSLDGTIAIDDPGADYCVRLSLKNDNNGHGPIVYKFLVCTDPSPWRF